MRYFFFTYLGDSLPVAYKLQKEGHDVTVGIVQDKSDVHSPIEGLIKPEDALSKHRRLTLYDNMLVKVPAWDLVDKIKGLKRYQDSFVFFDRNNLFKFADALHAVPIHGNFPTETDYLLEQDRDDAKQFVKKHYPYLQIPRVKEFSSVLEARLFLERTDKIWVLKGRDNAAKTYIPQTKDPKHAARQVISVLESAREIYERSGFILESFIPSVIELTPGKMYYDGKPIAILLNIENKPFGSGNTSVQTGCAQDLVFPISMTDEIQRIAFPKIVDQFAKKRKGLFYWDASLLIEEETGKMFFGEFCPNRPGYNQLFSELAQCKSVSSYFESIAKGESPFELGTVASSVSIFNPDTNEEEGNHPTRDVPIDYKATIEKDVWLWDVYKRGRRLVTAGDDWNLAVITGAGYSLKEAVDSAYANIEEFSFAGSYWRPKFDYLSLDYHTSILNRLNYGFDQGLYDIPFTVTVKG